jgi:HEAT repeat protein
MKNVVLGLVITIIGLFGSVALFGCHAAPDDAAGQAKELEDAVRRENAVTNLQSIFNNMLVKIKGDRSSPDYKKYVDAVVDQLSKVYVEHPEDTQNGIKILNLSKELKDPRSLPALIKALDWRSEITEDHAIAAAETIGEIKIPDDKKGEVIASIGKALDRVTGSRSIDNRMRKTFVETLGEIRDNRTTDTLIKIATNQTGNQNFLFNILAAQQITKIADPKAVPAMIKALYVFDAQNPAMRMNDVATSALVAIGRPSLAPLLKVLKGEDEEVNQLVKTYIQAVRQRDAETAANMNVPGLISTEATYALGKLGYREAIDPLIEETKVDDETRKYGAAIALVSINRKDEDTPKILAAIKKVYDTIDKIKCPQLLVAMRHLYAPEVMPFFLNVLKTYEFELSPIRLFAFAGYAFLANKAEMQNLKPFLEKGPVFKERVEMNFPHHEEIIKKAEECDENINCWIENLRNPDLLIVRKAANTIARFGRGNEKAIKGLVENLGNHDLEVRNEILSAIDFVAVSGSKAAVEKIDDMEIREDGRSIWNNFKREALPTRSRLAIRSSDK